MRNRTGQCVGNGVRHAADPDRLLEVAVRKRREGRLEHAPARLPGGNGLLPPRIALREIVNELTFPITRCLLAVLLQKVREARTQVSADMFHRDGDGIGVPVQRLTDCDRIELSDRVLAFPADFSELCFESGKDGATGRHAVSLAIASDGARHVPRSARH